MADIQCPNCGGYKTSTTGRHIRKERGPLWFKAILMVIFAGVGVVVLAGLLANARSDFDVKLMGLVAIVWVVCLVIIAVQKKHVTTGYTFACNLCGYRWDWHLGTPLPEVHVQPGLIAAGASRLAQEQATAAVACKGCGNTIPQGYPYCPYCGTSR